MSEVATIERKQDGVTRSRIKKVLLIQPPAFCNNMRSDMNPNAPLGIAYIAAVLEKENYDVEILDAFIEGWDQEERINEVKMRVGLSFAEIEDRIRAAAPDMVGITSMFTSQRKNVHEIARIVKAIDPNTPIVVGGAHPTAAPESIMEDPNIDIAVLAEGENVIVPIIEVFEGRRDVKSLDGLAYRDESGELVIVSKKTGVDDLDSIPFPARHLLPMEKYFASGVRHGGPSRGKRSASLITSRGCQYLCNFCTAFKVFTRVPRLRSTENVLAEIDELVNKYGVDEIYFEDDQILAKRSRAIELFDAMADRYDLMWDTPNGVSPWLLTEDILARMKKSGCYRVNLAIESGNQTVLDELINKPVKLKNIPKTVETIHKLGMEATTFIVVGNIGRQRVETIEEIKDSFNFAADLGVIPHVSLLTAYPGSEVLDIAQEKGYLVPGFDWDDLIIHKSQLQTDQWTPEQLEELVKTETKRLYQLRAYRSNPVRFVFHYLKSAVTMFFKNPILALTKTNHVLSAKLFRAS